MTEFFKEFGVVNEKAQDTLVQLVRRETTIPFQASQLYSSTEERKFIDTATRSSQYRVITAPEAFDLADQIVASLNALDSGYDFMLFRNDITQIQYKAGDFFKGHEDYLSIKSNAIVEFTMLMCIDASSDICGGETVFHINEWFQHTSKSSITRGHLLVFRKDIKHEGRLLERGTKEILTFNLLGIPKKCDITIAVTCLPCAEQEEEDEEKGEKTSAHILPSVSSSLEAEDTMNVVPPAAASNLCLPEGKSAAVMRMQGFSAVSRDKWDIYPLRVKTKKMLAGIESNEAVSSSSYSSSSSHPHEKKNNNKPMPQFFLSLSVVQKMEHTVLAAFARHTKAQQSAGFVAPSHIWLYNDEHHTTEEFDVIYRIYTKCYITLTEFKQHRAFIDFYGFELSDLLIDCGNSSSSSNPKTALSLQPTFCEDVLLCPNEACAQHMEAIILIDKLPYVRFKCILAEGLLTYGDGMSDVDPYKLELTPMWLAFGDEWHVLLKSRFISKSPLEWDLTNLAKEQPHCWRKNQLSENDFYDQSTLGTLFLGLVEKDNGSTLSQVLAQIVGPETDLIDQQYNDAYEGEEEEEKEEDDAEEEEEKDSAMPQQQLLPSDRGNVELEFYDIGDDRQTQLLRDVHYPAIIAQTIKLDLLEYVRSQIKTQSLQLVLAQSKQNSGHHFCNESVYGSASFVFVDGFIRMTPATST